MSRIFRTDGEWIQALQWRQARTTGVSIPVVCDGAKTKRLWEFVLPNLEKVFIDPLEYNALAAIHFTPNGWVEMTQEEFINS